MNSLTEKVVGELQIFIGQSLQDFLSADIGEYVFSLSGENLDIECQMKKVPFNENTSRYLIFDNKESVLIDVVVDEDRNIIEIK